ncbi:lipopolysaccharide heptosyltransferase II [Candidatus Omnitrophota bacterium]
MSAKKFQKILIVRTDRIGDVLLSTPVIKALRKNFPKSYIAMMVRPYAEDIVLGNPYLDEVIIYDKYGRQKSLWRSLIFAQGLRRKKFDLALVLHPTNRAHLVTFLAGIKSRVGYRRNLDFLLTDKVEHEKQKGQRHETQYALDFIRRLGVQASGTDLFMPVRKDSEEYIQRLLENFGLESNQKLVAFHPGASCPSKVWSTERFAQVTNRLVEQFKVKPVIVAGPNDVEIGKKLAGLIRAECFDFSGRTSVSQLASLLSRCALFISNDSGPVHIAAALGVPVVSIFGRRQPGLSPRRWGPTGKSDLILHRDLGCQPCQAHNCHKGFACLAAVSVDAVSQAAEQLLKTETVIVKG